MTDSSSSKPVLSRLDNRLLPILFGIALVVALLLGLIVGTISMTYARGAPVQHASGVMRERTSAVRIDARTVRSKVIVALPSQPIAAARDLVHSVGGVQLPCYPRNAKQWYLESRGCPVTSGYRRYLLAHSRDADPVCGCQNYAIRNTFRLLFERAGLATVAATLTFTYNTLYIVFVEVKRGNGWMVTASYVTHT